jgi:HD-GYP domain-containing protein (c-di-GMP phosphodiesterase class II)
MSSLPGTSASPGETVRERCRAMGLATWRADTGGVITEEPQEAGLAGLWLRSGHIGGLVADSAREWADNKRPTIRNLMPGCWLIPVPEEQNRRRTGMTLAMAMAPELLGSEDFSLACRGARLDEQTTRATMRKLTTFDEGSARRAAGLLQWMVRDLSLLSEYQDAVSGFTSELTDSYETIDLLYGLGRSMLDLDHPERFVSLLCDRLYDTMPFGWVAAKFMPTEAVLASLGGEVLVRGQCPLSGPELSAAITRLALRTPSAPADRRGFIVSAREEFNAKGESRVLVQPVTRGDQLAGLLLVGDKHGEDPQISSYDMQLLEAAAAFTGAFLENTQLYRDHQLMFLGSIRALTSAIDAKDRYTCGHSERVALMAAKLARAIGLDAATVERIHICGLLHDVGKIGVPEAVLCKPGRLTEQEFALIKLHPEIGYRILKDIPQLTDVLPGVLHHHQRWDGKGYPEVSAEGEGLRTEGAQSTESTDRPLRAPLHAPLRAPLRGEQIPLFGRLLALADTFDAMSSTRSYRAAMPRDQVLAEIARNAGHQFDPDLAKTFITLDLSDYDTLVAHHAREHQGHPGAHLAAPLGPAPSLPAAA